ncbi:MAG: hypothetical protein FD156_1533 [Nitrospirae bacterium]|nr:MAG: hypothetical protein FD156_1533 [Nitrospirota bacterium]
MNLLGQVIVFSLILGTDGVSASEVLPVHAFCIEAGKKTAQTLFPTLPYLSWF